MPIMMSAKQEETLRFFQYVEDCGLGAYSSIVTCELMWNEKSRSLQEKNDKKRKQEEVVKRASEEVAVEGKHLRMGSGTMSEPPQQFSVRSQSLHSVGGEEDEGSPNSRKQPPPKPRRDPNTKLSASSEAVDNGASSCRGGHAHKWDVTQSCGDDCRRVPPPKPKRNPNTQLSTSFDDSYILNASKDSPPMSHCREIRAASPISPFSPPKPLSPQRDSDSEEPVYIEMSGNVGQNLPPHAEMEEPGEAVYEEMKYPALDDFDSRWDLLGYRSQSVPPCPSDIDLNAYTRSVQLCDIPAPFPNLLSHRPPLLVFPSVPVQCSPNSEESPLTPMDVNKIPTLENAPYPKSPSSSSSSMDPLSSASSSHLRRAERELTATPTITVSGRSSAPPLPCARYRSSTGSAGSQRSHSACPSPVSMGRCLTPLSLMRTPPADGPLGGAVHPRHHNSAQNVAAGRSRTPTSPLDELTNLFTSGRNMLKTKASGRKSKEPGESESKGKESKREHKEKSHHSKESKRDKERNGKSSHRRESKDREHPATEVFLPCDSKDRLGSNVEPVARQDSKDRSSSHAEPLVRRDSKDRGYSNGEQLIRRISKEKGPNSMEPLARCNSKDRSCSGPEINLKQCGKDRTCNSAEPIMRHDGKTWVCNGMEPLPRLDSKDRICLAPEIVPRQGSKDRLCSASEPLLRHDSKDWLSSSMEPLPRLNSKDRICNGQELIPRQGSKDRLCSATEPLQRNDGKDWVCNGTEALPKRDSKDRICPGPELIARRGSKERAGSTTEPIVRHDSKEWVGNEMEALPKWGSKDRLCSGPDHLHRQDCKDFTRNGLERSDSRGGFGSDLLPRHCSKDLGRTGLESRRNSKEGRRNILESHQGTIADHGLSNNGVDATNGRDCKDKGVLAMDPPNKSKDKGSCSTESPKAHEWDSRSGPLSRLSSRYRRPPLSPTTILGNSELKTVPKTGRSHSVPSAPSPLGTPRRKASEAQEMPPFPWVYGDSTMQETIERKQRLCCEIRSRQWLPDRSPSKTESASATTNCKKASGPKKHGPPPYPAQSNVFWDTAI